MQKRIVLTGGPSAGKTTLLNWLGHHFENKIHLAPEAATILFSNGHPRPNSFEEALFTQRKIFKIQRDLELIALERSNPFQPEPLFCDRGSLDGGAYWPGSLDHFCESMETTLESEVARYTAIIHLQSPNTQHGYRNTSIRTESAEEAAALDARIGEYWKHHSNYFFIPHEDSFSKKLTHALEILKPYLPNSNFLHPINFLVSNPRAVQHQIKVAL